MNSEEAKRYLKHLELIEAMAEGKTIQLQATVGGPWYDESNPQFTNGYSYRIKPTPRKVWLMDTGRTLVLYEQEDKPSPIYASDKIHGPFEFTA